MEIYLPSQKPFRLVDYSSVNTAGEVKMRLFHSYFSGIQHMAGDRGGAQK